MNAGYASVMSSLRTTLSLTFAGAMEVSNTYMYIVLEIGSRVN